MSDLTLTEGMVGLPLRGVRVIDMVGGAMAMVGKQLVDLGAEVLYIEPPLGRPERRTGPQLHGVGVEFLANNTGKRSITLDLGDAGDAERFHHLLDRSDILLHAMRPGEPDLCGRDLLQLHPHLVVQTISDFGVESPCRDWTLTDAVAHALSGELWRSGMPEREPLLPPGQLAYTCAASQAVFTALVAYYHKLRTGAGDWLDFSILDGAVAALDPGFGIAGSAANGQAVSELPDVPRPDMRTHYPIFRCKDGHIRVCILSSRQWRKMHAWMGSPKEFADPSFDRMQARFTSVALNAALAAFYATRTRETLEREGAEHGVPVAGLLSTPETIASEHLKSRNAVRSVEVPGGGVARQMNGMIEIDGHRAAGRAVVEDVGQSQAMLEQSQGERRHAVGILPMGARPLEGIRVLDLGVIVAGAEQGRQLADQGAEVYKVENSTFPDGSRQSSTNSTLSVTFAAGHRNKRSLGLNLKTEEGKRIFRGLVVETDVIFSNFKPGTLDSLGLAYEELRKINPQIVMVDSSAFGNTGPWSYRLGYGPLVRAVAGLTNNWRYEDDQESFSDSVTIYPDHTAGRIGATAALALLIRRVRTGRGGTASISQLEVILSQMDQQVMAACSGQSLPVRAPICRPFRAAGEDEWVVVCSQDRTQWPALCQVIDRPELAATLREAGSDRALAHVGELISALEAWMAIREPADAMDLLQSRGISAGAMLCVSELPQFKHFSQRRLFRWVRNPYINRPFLMERSPVHSLRLPEPAARPAPLLGEQTLEILQERLGFSIQQLEQLLADGHIEVPAAV